MAIRHSMSLVLSMACYRAREYVFLALWKHREHRVRRNSLAMRMRARRVWCALTCAPMQRDPAAVRMTYQTSLCLTCPANALCVFSLNVCIYGVYMFVIYEYVIYSNTQHYREWKRNVLYIHVNKSETLTYSSLSNINSHWINFILNIKFGS